MADAGVADSGIFSILHSCRTGPTDIKAGKPPRPQIAHVISLEFVDEMDTPADDDMVALISLYSWNYLCQPPLSINFVDDMRAVGEQVKIQSSMLRCSDLTINNLHVKAQTLEKVVDDPDAPGISIKRAKLYQKLIDRLSQGYSLVRHRYANGQVGVAFNRSPFAPVLVQTPPGWPTSSSNGQAYQILDRDLGIVDVTYAGAWQLGRVTAVADMGFVAALLRLRYAPICP